MDFCIVQDTFGFGTLLVHFPKDLTFPNKIMNSELIQEDFSTDIQL